jgi:hypothetical protein
MPQRSFRTFTVLPSIPDRLKALTKLAYNLWWCWHADAAALFRRIDPALFTKLDHSPIRLGYAIEQKRLVELTTDESFLAHLDRVSGEFDSYINAQTWFQQNHAEAADLKIAYFSMEFGMHESVPVYSGGLGVLAGDQERDGVATGFVGGDFGGGVGLGVDGFKAGLGDGGASGVGDGAGERGAEVLGGEGGEDGEEEEEAHGF